MDNILEVQQISRSYNKHSALEKLDFSLAIGDVLGLLGHNGAGKTTTLKIIAGILEPTKGFVRLFGKNPLNNQSCREKTAYLPEIAQLNNDLTVAENIFHFARLHNLSKKEAQQQTQETLKTTQLEALKNTLLTKLSKGNYQRVALACTIVHKPTLVLLDEPASGLDPIQIGELRKLILKISQHSAVIVSSHMLSEIAQICNRYLILRHGKQVYCSDEKTTENTQQQYDIKIEEKTDGNINWPSNLQKIEVQSLPNHFIISVTDIKAHTLLQQLLQNKIPVTHFSEKKHTLEELFIEYSR